ncbi:hypothetical protein AB0J56_35600 [Actinoplanes xinjiangensis]
MKVAQDLGQGRAVPSISQPAVFSRAVTTLLSVPPRRRAASA